MILSHFRLMILFLPFSPAYQQVRSIDIGTQTPTTRRIFQINAHNRGGQHIDINTLHPGWRTATET